MALIDFFRKKPTVKKSDETSKEDFSIYGGYGGYIAGLSRVEDAQNYLLVNSNSDDTNLVNNYHEIKKKMKGLTRNNVVANAIINNIKSSTLQNGFKFTADIPNKQKLNDLIENEFAIFKETIDASGEYTLEEMVSIAFEHSLIAGDSFGLIVGTGSDEYKTKVRIIDPDRVDTPFSTGNNEKDIVLGIEKDKYGDKKAVYILQEHPENNLGDADYFRRQFKDKNGLTQVMHLYNPKFVSQTRGLPLLTHCFNAIMDLDMFVRTELNTAKNSSNWNMVITTPFAGERAAQLNTQNKTRPSAAEKNRPVFYNSPGAVNVLQPGEEIHQVKLERPTGMFAPFVISQLKTICASLGLSYSYIWRDLAELNYAGARFDALQNQVVLRQWQENIIRRFLNPIRDMFLMEFLSKYNPDIEFSELKKFVRFVPPSFQIMDITKELTASQLAMEIGVSNLQMENAKYGNSDYEGILQQLAREKKEKEALGLTDAQKPVASNANGDVQTTPNTPGKIPNSDGTRG